MGAVACCSIAVGPPQRLTYADANVGVMCLSQELRRHRWFREYILLVMMGRMAAAAISAPVG